MNIIAGTAGGIRLDVPKGVTVRPTGAIARKSLFDSLGNLSGQTVVDLFAGSGALGLEAASRGASSVVLVDLSRHAIETINLNVSRVRKAGVDADIRALRHAAETAHLVLPELAGKVDLILADPPYDDTTAIAARLLGDEAFAQWARGALLIFEASRETSRNAPISDNSGLWQVVKTKTMGQTAFYFLKIPVDRNFSTCAEDLR